MEAEEREVDQVVKLQVGNCRYLTTKSTLISKGSNFFTALLSGKIPSTMYEGAYFIDRSGELFAPILEYLRTGELHIPENMSQLAVIREVQFYGIDLSQQTTFISDIWLREIQFCHIKEISEIKEIVFQDWINAAHKGLPVKSRIFSYGLDSICKLLENEFELSNKNAFDYPARKKQFLELLPEVKEKYNNKIQTGEIIGNSRCVTFLNKEENRVILLDHFKTFHPDLSVQITQQRAYRVTYKSYTNMDFFGWQFTNTLVS